MRNILIKKVIKPLKERFPTPSGDIGFEHGRLHSFRHFFCSAAASGGIPVAVLMVWLGHQDSGMVRHYYHLYDVESQARMRSLDFQGAGNRDGAVDPPPDGTETPPDG